MDVMAPSRTKAKAAGVAEMVGKTNHSSNVEQSGDNSDSHDSTVEEIARLAQSMMKSVSITDEGNFKARSLIRPVQKTSRGTKKGYPRQFCEKCLENGE